MKENKYETKLPARSHTGPQAACRLLEPAELQSPIAGISYLNLSKCKQGQRHLRAPAREPYQALSRAGALRWCCPCLRNYILM